MSQRGTECKQGALGCMRLLSGPSSVIATERDTALVGILNE